MTNAYKIPCPCIFICWLLHFVNIAENFSQLKYSFILKFYNSLADDSYVKKSVIIGTIIGNQ